MKIIEDRKNVNALTVLKEISHLTTRISVLLSDLVLELSLSALPEALESEPLQEAREASEIIKELQGYFAQLRTVILLFDHSQIIPSSAIQYELSITTANLNKIRDCLIDLYDLRNNQNIKRHNNAIRNIIIVAHRTIVGTLKQIEDYVKAYNMKNQKKLNFKIKWTKLHR